jgi:hypothetical protein
MLGMLMGVWWCALLLLIGAAIYLKQPFQRLPHTPLWSRLGAAEKATAALLVPVIRVVGDVAKMIGYPIGVQWKQRHRNAA